MDDLSKAVIVERIMNFALEDLSTWTRPQPLKSVGKAFPGVYAEFALELEALKQDLRTQLAFFSETELASKFEDFPRGSFNLLFDPDGQIGHLARRLARMKRDVPADYVGGWATKGHEVDQPFWRKMASFTLAEAAMLSMGRDPRKTSYSAVMQQYGRSKPGDEVLYCLEDRYNAIANALGLDPANEQATVEAEKFYEWIDTFSVEVDERFRRQMTDRRKKLARVGPKPIGPGEPSKPTTLKRVHRSSERVHARILLAMAMAKYGLKGIEGIGKAVKAISADADLQGLGFDDTVLRNLLKMGLADMKPIE